jgi:Uma2 family endonuclease
MRDAIGDRPIRITYDRGDLEFMSPSDVHERLKNLLNRMLVILSEELDVPLRGQGSTTFHSQAFDRALEPDECYYIQNEIRIRGRDEIDLSIDPPPDLAIEIDVTGSSLNRMGIYAALGVPEVWRYDGKTVRIHALQPDGNYKQVPRSLAFPTIRMSEISSRLAKRNELDDLSWARDFRQWVRQTGE